MINVAYDSYIKKMPALKTEMNGGIKMSVTIQEAKEMIQSVPREDLGFFPTPMYRLDKLSDKLGINLYIKRDDFSGKNLFGGNKVRKLEFLIGKALQDKCEYVFTYGATQSNHAMQTVWTAVKSGLKPILYLAAVVEPDENDIKANLLLDKIFGAEIHIVSLQENESFMDAEKRSFSIGAEHLKKLEAEGHICMDIPMGGSNEVGATGYISGMIELCEQADKAGITFDYLYHSTGSGGTVAGLAAGKKLLGKDMEIHSIAALETDRYYGENMADLANKALEYIGGTPLVTKEDFIIDTGYFSPGYECPNEGMEKAVRMVAKEEGILLDPVYTGKAFAGLLSDIRTGKVKQGSSVVFVHTGGATGLFAEKAILGKIY